ncbi:transmembrane protein 53 [Parachaetomium inaequale]|uniref:Transmembrane protein 53 n=1 Tax=Parachaetomium inaequale TaxID=2588326 RepID=A0AAN6PBE8_9PEZI|nr:transmembrane protein 53 [Parachaetomium inaequale]
MSKAVVEAESSILGFKKLSNQVYVQEGQPSSQDSSHPTTIIIYGWGDALPKHVAKYVDGYRQLFPHARFVLIFSPILKTLYQTLEARSRTMVPAIEAVCPETLKNPSTQGKSDERVLLHVMSNTGGINCAATMNAYTKHTNGAIFPHDMLVCDSTPGSTDFLPNVGRWSRAMALGAARWFPWPFAVTQALAAVFLGCLHGFGWLIGATSAAEFSKLAANDARFADEGAKRLYLYSKEDDIIHWEDIEKHAADARQKGFSVTAELFEGTPHVGHMRVHPERYWAAIAAAWTEAVASKERK